MQDVSELDVRGTKLEHSTRPYAFHQVFDCMENLADINKS
jgi:hypothetical protein